MAYNPLMYNPYGSQQPYSWSQPPIQQQPVNGLVQVNGDEGAKMFPLPPNSVSQPLFYSDEDVFAIKTTDAGGSYTLKKYSFSEIPFDSPANDGKYVTKEYLDEKLSELKEAINGKQPAAKQSSK